MRRINAFEFINRTIRRIPAGISAPRCTDILLEHDGTCLVVRKTASNEAWVSLVVGNGLGWARELKKLFLLDGIYLVGFITKQDNKAMNSIARYFKAELKKDEKDNLIYCINLKGGRF